MGVHAYCIIEWTPFPFSFSSTFATIKSHSLHALKRLSRLVQPPLFSIHLLSVCCSFVCLSIVPISNCFLADLIFYSWLIYSSFVKQQKQEPLVSREFARLNNVEGNPKFFRQNDPLWKMFDLPKLFTFSPFPGDQWTKVSTWFVVFLLCWAPSAFQHGAMAQVLGIMACFEPIKTPRGRVHWGHRPLAGFSLGRSAKLVLPALLKCGVVVLLLTSLYGWFVEKFWVLLLRT